MHNPYKYLPSTLLRRALCKLTLTIPSGGRKTLHIYNIHIRIHINKDFISTNTCGEVVFNHCPISKHIFLFFFFLLIRNSSLKFAFQRMPPEKMREGSRKLHRESIQVFSKWILSGLCAYYQRYRVITVFFFFFLLSARKFCF